MTDGIAAEEVDVAASDGGGRQGRYFGLVVAAVGLGFLAWAWRADRAWLELHTTMFFCAQDPKELAPGKAFRVLALILGLVTLALAPLAWRWGARRPPSAIAGTVLRLGGAGVLALLVCDVYLRRKPLPPGEVPLWFYPHVADTELDWVPVPSSHYVVNVDDRAIVYDIDPYGLRIAGPGAAPDPGKPSILFAGESVAYGLDTPYPDTYAALVSERFGVQALSAGVVGYGNTQVYLLTKRLLETFKAPVAIVTLVLRQETTRELRDPVIVLDWKHLAVARDGSLVPADPPPRAWRNHPLRRLLERVPLHGDEPIDITRAIFKATAREARARHAVPLFVLTNFEGPGCLRDVSEQPDLERILLDDPETPYIRVDLDPKFRPVSRNHPDARAHVVLAAAIEGKLRELGLRTGGAGGR